MYQMLSALTIEVIVLLHDFYNIKIILNCNNDKKKEMY